MVKEARKDTKGKEKKKKKKKEKRSRSEAQAGSDEQITDMAGVKKRRVEELMVTDGGAISATEPDKKKSKKKKKKQKKEKKNKKKKKDKKENISDDSGSKDELIDPAAAAEHSEEVKEVRPVGAVEQNEKVKDAGGAQEKSGGADDGEDLVSQSRRLFCGNLSFQIDEDTLRKAFKDCGEVTDIHWVTDKQTGKFYGTAFVEFASSQAVRLALGKNGKKILGRALRCGVAKHRAPTGESAQPVNDKPDGCNTIFIGNLSFEIDESTVRDAFGACGEIVDVRWVTKDDVFKGCGFVEFADSSSVDKAMKLSGTPILGRSVRIDFQAPK